MTNGTERAYYLDTSALAKFVVEESESAALRAWVDSVHGATTATSDLSRTELARAVRRRDSSLMPRVRELLDSLTVLTVPSSVFDEAGRLGEVGLRSLDAIHLASALALGDELEAIVTYDERTARCAAELGVRAIAPT